VPACCSRRSACCASSIARAVEYPSLRAQLDQPSRKGFRRELLQPQERRLLERTIELAQRTKAFDYKKLPKTLRLAVDSRPLTGASRVEDIVNLLGHAARKLLECAAAPTEAPRAAPPSLLAVDGANATVSDTEADGLHLTELACAVDRPLLGTLAIIGALSKQASAFDRCAPRGDAAILHWSFEGGRPQDITVRGASSKKVDACLVAALNKIRAPFDARCGAVLHVGDEKGAREAHARLPTGE